jgi:hypothetical protein
MPAITFAISSLLLQFCPTAGAWAARVWTVGVWTVGVWTAGVWTAGVWTAGVWTAGVWMAGVWMTGVWDRRYEAAAPTTVTLNTFVIIRRQYVYSKYAEVHLQRRAFETEIDSQICPI